jgi:hypothetical protein
MLYDKKWDKEVKVVDEVGKMILKAADWLEEHGWCQGWMDDDRGRSCAMGAVWNVTKDMKIYVVAARRIGRAASIDYGSPSSVVRWNDKPGRTAEEVMAIMRHAASQ